MTLEESFLLAIPGRALGVLPIDADLLPKLEWIDCVPAAARIKRQEEQDLLGLSRLELVDKRHDA